MRVCVSSRGQLSLFWFDVWGSSQKPGEEAESEMVEEAYVACRGGNLIGD
jgi:hypothetical protein